ncbi:MAG: hypothetical protein BWY76_01694 [bacterium ADurb.Bin429]|nr:MAG: hypothetical protein BWY76_01694 [bacterium ADurb.Bin429]
MRSVAVLLGLLLMLAAHAGEQRFTLREQLRVTWTDELVTFPFTAPKGACHPASVTLVGPKGPLPVQLIEVELWPGTAFVKSARVAFVTDLAPLATDIYILRYDKAPATGLSADTDLRITTGKDFVELSNGKFGVKLPLGEQAYDPPANAAGIPGPVMAMRLADGAWFGGSARYGARKIRRFSARVTESGPVVGRVSIREEYEDGATLETVVQLAARNSRAIWETHSAPPPGIKTEDREKYERDIAAKNGWLWLMNRGIDRLSLQTLVHQSYTLRWGTIQKDRYGNLARDLQDFDLTAEKPGTLISLLAWAGWWNQQQQSWFNFSTPVKGAILGISSLYPERWEQPGAPGGAWNGRKWLPLEKDERGEIFFRVNTNLGDRYWTFGGPFEKPRWERREAFLNGCPEGIWPLDRVKDLVLDWPGDEGSHPRVFLNKQDLARIQAQPLDGQRLDDLLNYARVYQYIDLPTYRDPNPLLAYLLTGSPIIAEKVNLVERLRIYLGQLGNFDRMRSASQLAGMYDALIDSDLISAKERRVFRAQMAYLAYACCDPSNWSYERGFASGNQNMTVAHVLNQGMLAATIPDHPMAKAWSAPALAMMEEWLNTSVGPNGEWPESMANYAEVSAAMLVVYAVAAKNAGIKDYTRDTRLQRLMLYLTKQYTPPDPRFAKPGTAALVGSPPSGRGPAYHQSGLSGMMAKALATDDPAFSRIMQWHWLRAGQSTGYLSDRMGGLEQLYMDPTLPAETPPWGTEHFPWMGALLRQGVGTPREYYLNFIMEPKGYTCYYSESGAFAAIWAKGAPISVRFAGHGYAEREEILISRVLPAREVGALAERKARFMYKGPIALTALAPLSRQDYLAATMRMETPVKLWHPDQTHTDVLPKWPPAPNPGKPPVDWTRRALFIKDRDERGVNYLVLRDTVTGGQPTMWQFWTLSEKIGTPEEVKDLAAFLADKPGNKAMDAREIRGSRFTAVGQCGVDVEYYIAAPTNTPRHTLRWGHTYYDKYSEYQDLLHLQLPTDGAYFVALFPRLRGEAAPAFTTLGEGKIIKVKGAFGTDYVFLADGEATAEAEGIAFRGEAASVQDRPTGLVLSLAAAGEIRHPKGYALAADGPTSLRVGQVLTVEAPPSDKPRAIAFTAPGAWVPAKSVPGLALAQEGNRWTVTLPTGVTSVMLVAP